MDFFQSPKAVDPRFDLTAAQRQRRDNDSTKPGSEERPVMEGAKSGCSEALVENVFRHRWPLVQTGQPRVMQLKFI
jgi:hypothetical protein